MVYELGTPGFSGLGMVQPVIPPLSTVGSVRCSVKPASRYALHFKYQETKALAKIPWPSY